ncbi:prolactin-releasing peptide receptor-like [Thalassophryne amazonica]|uniref:prolactin-releasing peptide receptor-like n=1 Tax=Thalassophryne amazonica TaxID=390379 RepID=UPI001471636A|nr:prolactin-releasing peptide receptor-like [Thalassophryne amazonica]
MSSRCFCHFQTLSLAVLHRSRWNSFSVEECAQNLHTTKVTSIHSEEDHHTGDCFYELSIVFNFLFNLYSLNALLLHLCFRYYATVHPLKKRTSMVTHASILTGIWLLSCGLVAPAVAHTYYVEFKEEGFTICEEFWLEQEKERLVYAYSTLLVTYVLLLSAIFISYLCISVKLKNCVAPGHRTQDQCGAQQARKRKIFRLVALLVSAFTVCWLPIHVFVLRDIDIHLINKRYFLLIQLLCHLCAMTSSCCNPFLYAWLHGRFRCELQKMFKRRHRIGVPVNQGVTSVVL